MKILTINSTPSTSDRASNVRELIDTLKLYPQNMEVWAGTGLGIQPVKIENVKLDEI